MTAEEFCVRCGVSGPDLRTLYHACFYRMDEHRPGRFTPPFETKTLFHADLEALETTKDPTVLTTQSGVRITIAPGRVRSDGELTPQMFYTLRVCKTCRAQWMDVIDLWFDLGRYLASNVRERNQE